MNDTLSARAKSRALKIRITGEVRDRARNGRYAYVHDRGQDFAAGIWVIDSAFMVDLVHEQLNDDDATPAREEAYFAGAWIDDTELRDAAAEDAAAPSSGPRSARRRHPEQPRARARHPRRTDRPHGRPTPRSSLRSSAGSSSATTAS